MPDWSDRVPTAVIVLALGSAYSGLLALPLTLRPTIPWFGSLWTGDGARVITLLLGLTLLVLGWGLFRQRRIALGAIGALTTFLGISTAWTHLSSVRPVGAVRLT